jgi:hypothetical protein
MVVYFLGKIWFPKANGPTFLGETWLPKPSGPKTWFLVANGPKPWFLGENGLKVSKTNMVSHVPLLLKTNHVSQGTLGPFPNSIWKIKFQLPFSLQNLPQPPFVLVTEPRKWGQIAQ